MLLYHIGAMIPLWVMFVIGVSIYRKAAIFYGAIAYSFVLTWIAYTGSWDGLIFAAYLPISFMSLVAAIYLSSEGEFV